MSCLWRILRTTCTSYILFMIKKGNIVDQLKIQSWWMGTDMIMDVYMINAKVNMIKQYSKNWIVKLVGDYRLYTKLFLNFLWVTLFYAELLKIFKIKKLVKSKSVNVIN